MPRQNMWLMVQLLRLLVLTIALCDQTCNIAIAQPQNVSAPNDIGIAGGIRIAKGIRIENGIRIAGGIGIANGIGVANGIGIPNGIKIEENIFYAPEHNLSQSLDLYLPEHTPKRPMPTVIFIHGGSWQAGDKKEGRIICQEFVRRGYATASVNYRFSNQAIWPAQAIDCKSAVRWLRVNASKYNLDANRFAVGGHSAGGHLSAFLATTNGVKLFDQGQNLQVSSDVQAELWFAGVGNLVSRATTRGYQGEQTPKSAESKLLGGPIMLRRHLALGASPVTWVSKSTVPFFFEAGTVDKAVPPNQVFEMKTALDKFGIYSEVYFLPGVGHIGGEYFDLAHFNLMDSFLQKVLKIDKVAP
jgi:acetyl esterase/lipase